MTNGDYLPKFQMRANKKPGKFLFFVSKNLIFLFWELKKFNLFVYQKVKIFSYSQLCFANKVLFTVQRVQGIYSLPNKRAMITNWEWQSIGLAMFIITCCIFRPAFGCCALQTLVEMGIFSIFAAKNHKKQEFCSKFQQKTVFFAFHQNAGRLFYSQKNKLFPLFDLLYCIFNGY